MPSLKIGEVSVAAVVALALVGTLVALALIVVISAVQAKTLPDEIVTALVVAIVGGVNLVIGFFFGRRNAGTE